MRGGAKPKESKPPLSKEEAAEIVAAIRRVGAAGKVLQASGLKRRAVVVLLHDATAVPMVHIVKVLDGLEELTNTFLVQP